MACNKSRHAHKALLKTTRTWWHQPAKNCFDFPAPACRQKDDDDKIFAVFQQSGEKKTANQFLVCNLFHKGEIFSSSSLLSDVWVFAKKISR